MWITRNNSPSSTIGISYDFYLNTAKSCPLKSRNLRPTTSEDEPTVLSPSNIHNFPELIAYKWVWMKPTVSKPKNPTSSCSSAVRQTPARVASAVRCRPNRRLNCNFLAIIHFPLRRTFETFCHFVAAVASELSLPACSLKQQSEDHHPSPDCQANYLKMLTRWQIMNFWFET